MIDTFAPRVAPSVGGTSLDETPAILTTKFGDGYTQDMPDGLNSVRGAVSLSWDPIQPSDADTMIAFFRAQSGRKFFYTLPRETVPRQWIATKWHRAYPYAASDSFTVSLEERFGAPG